MLRIFTRLLVISILMPPLTALAADEPPRLVLQITVDQLRGDQPAKYLDKMGEGGFRYLLEKAVVYENAHHAHSNTETIVGHATLATGAYPADHGLIANVWFDRKSGELIYNIEDARYPLLTAGADVNKATEVDPTQAVARTDGRSPASMLVSTFGDQLAIHTAGQAKIFGVSIVERLWRSVKYEEVYLNAYESLTEARQSLKKYFRFYNQHRKHQTLKSTPDQVYYESIGLPEAA